MLDAVPTIQSQLTLMQVQLNQIVEEMKFNGGKSFKDLIARILEAHDLDQMRWQLLEQASPIGIYECDANGSCIKANLALCEMFGLTEAEMMGNGWLESVGRSQLEKDSVYNSWRAAVQKSIPYKDKYWLTPREGDALEVMTYAQALRSQKTGNVLIYRGVVTPVLIQPRNSKDA